MRANSFMRIDTFSRRSIALLLGLALLFCTFGCGPSSQSGADEASGAGAPELTDDVIRERINFAFIRGIPEESGTSDPINWTFYQNEPKEIRIVEKQIEGDHAVVILDIKTESSPRSRSPKSLAGQIRTEWGLRTGWVLRKWEIVDIENISIKYRNLPKPVDQDSNSNSNSSRGS